MICRLHGDSVYSNTRLAATRGTFQLGVIGSGTIESLKWLGLIVMFGEHWMRYVVGDLPGWLYQCGRVAFPLFVLALALGLRNLPDSKLPAAVMRLFAWAAVSQAGLELVDAPENQLNVLFTLGLGVAIVVAFMRTRSPFLLALTLCAAGAVAVWCEFGVVGAAFVAAAVALARASNPPAAAWIGVAALLAALAIANRSHAGLAAVPLAMVALSLDIRVPRVRRLFYWAYAFQFPLYAGARMVLSSV